MYIVKPKVSGPGSDFIMEDFYIVLMNTAGLIDDFKFIAAQQRVDRLRFEGAKVVKLADNAPRSVERFLDDSEEWDELTVLPARIEKHLEEVTGSIHVMAGYRSIQIVSNPDDYPCEVAADIPLDWLPDYKEYKFEFPIVGYTTDGACPFEDCGAPMAECDEVSTSNTGDVMRRHIKCGMCGREWDEVYRITNIEYPNGAKEENNWLKII